MSGGNLASREDLLKITAVAAKSFSAAVLLTQPHRTKNPWGRYYTITQYFVPVHVALQCGSPHLRRRAREAAKRLMRVT